MCLHKTAFVSFEFDRNFSLVHARSSFFSVSIRPAAMQAQQGVPKTAAAGCYKCGKNGHWAKDCTAPRSEWVPRDQTGAPGRPPATEAGAENNPSKQVWVQHRPAIVIVQRAPAPFMSPSLPSSHPGIHILQTTLWLLTVMRSYPSNLAHALPCCSTDKATPAPELLSKKYKRAPRPKLTLELLKKPSGLPDVFHNFPILYRRAGAGFSEFWWAWQGISSVGKSPSPDVRGHSACPPAHS
jgi:hypothetical protein